MSVAMTLRQFPERFDFVQAIRLLEQLGSQRLTLCAEAMPLGDVPPVQQALLQGEQWQVKLALEALSGARGVLPDYLYQALLDSLHQDEFALQQFLDIFNQRFYQQLYQTLAGQQLLLEDQRSIQHPSRVSPRQALSQLSAMPQAIDTPVQYSLLMGLKTGNLSVLKQLLEDYFALQVQLKVLESSVRRLPDHSTTRLSAASGRNNGLGTGMLLGRTAKLHRRYLEIYLEPRGRREFLTLKSDTQLAQTVSQMARGFLREASDIKLYLRVKRAFIQAPQLSANNRHSVALGEANCLAPQYNPEAFQNILLS